MKTKARDDSLAFVFLDPKKNLKFNINYLGD